MLLSYDFTFPFTAKIGFFFPRMRAFRFAETAPFPPKIPKLRRLDFIKQITNLLY
jgi:hypothetical protein